MENYIAFIITSSICVAAFAVFSVIFEKRKFRRTLLRLEATRRPGVFDRYEGLSDESLESAFASGKNHEVYRAACQVIDSHAKDLVVAATDMQLSSEQTKYLLGGVAALTDVRESMEEMGLEEEQRESIG